MVFNRTCSECGVTFQGERRHAEFCTGECKTMFNNRRKNRGSIIYDMFMAMRYERDLAKKFGAWTDMCKLAAHWRREDMEKREARRSWGDWRTWQKNNPWLEAVVVQAVKKGNWSL